MGIGFVLFFWAIAGTVLASAGALVFGRIAASLTKQAPGSWGRVIVFASAFPFVCLGWAVVLFIFRAFVNSTFLNRDVGLGDSWSCPLPNGYAILMIDVTDQGLVYDPKTHGDDPGFNEKDALAGVRLLQVAGQYILGASDSHSVTAFGKPATDPDLYFLLDTKTGKSNDFTNPGDLSRAALELGVQLKLEDIETVYSRYRFTWFDELVGFLLIVPLATYFVALVYWILRIRRSRNMIPSPA